MLLLSCLMALSSVDLDDKTIKLWDPHTGKELQTLKGHTDRVCALALLPDGTLVSGSGDKTIKLWK